MKDLLNTHSTRHETQTDTSYWWRKQDNKVFPWKLAIVVGVLFVTLKIGHILLSGNSVPTTFGLHHCLYHYFSCVLSTVYVCVSRLSPKTIICYNSISTCLALSWVWNGGVIGANCYFSYCILFKRVFVIFVISNGVRSDERNKR